VTSEAEPAEAGLVVEPEVTEAAEAYRSNYWPTLSFGWVADKVRQLLDSTASKLTRGLKKFEQVMASAPWALNYISQGNCFMNLQLAGKYAMSRKGIKQKLKRRAIKTGERQVRVGEAKEANIKWKQLPSNQSTKEARDLEEEEREKWAEEYQARHRAKLITHGKFREAKWREYALRCVDRWPKGGAKNLRDLVTLSPPQRGIIYTDGIDLSSVDLDKVKIHPSLYSRRIMESPTEHSCDRSRRYSRLKRTQAQHPVIQRKEMRLKTVFTNLARGLKSIKVRKYRNPDAKLNRVQRIQWESEFESVPFEEWAHELRSLKTRKSGHRTEHNKVERVRWWSELKTFTSRLWKDSAHPRITPKREDEVGMRKRLYKLQEAYDQERGHCLVFVKIVNDEGVTVNVRSNPAIERKLRT
jgi:hypothetical protein